jgi:uncharacterized protein with HEPN domain
MSDEILKYIEDMLKAIQLIEQFVGKRPSFVRYQKDTKTKYAVERNLEIIGEALNKALKIQPDLAVSSARQIVATRNRLIHTYDAVDDYLIWEIITNHLLKLKSELLLLKEII